MKGLLLPTAPHQLTTLEHSRDAVGLTYVYPVVSRRSGGVSVGINLNPNNACNWRCAYCQVPGLKRGRAPEIDLVKLRAELRGFLHELLFGTFMQDCVPEGSRRINDIALSGNGEPTSAREFAQVIELIGQVMAEFGLIGAIKLVLITNGSLMHRGYVQEGLKKMAALNGEVWFKLDSATPEGAWLINGTRISLARTYDHLCTAAALCPTLLQTCVFARDGKPPGEVEQEAYLAFIARLVKERVPIKGVLLYGLARPSMQPEAERLLALPLSWMEQFAAEIEARGIPAKLSL
jgi:wyosine [tRNA(Phe)-imidazoG37] synthetase (radical SAM superfamily)